MITIPGGMMISPTSETRGARLACEGPRLSTLLLLRSEVSASDVPICFGLCLPEGEVRDARQLQLVDAAGKEIVLQAEPLAHWYDGSVKWMLLDFVAPIVPAGDSEWRLNIGSVEQPTRSVADVRPGVDPVTIDLGRGKLRLRHPNCSNGVGLSFRLRLRDGRVVEPRSGPIAYETRGPVRTTIRVDGSLPTAPKIRFLARISVYAGIGLARISARLHNSGRARHRGGLWDLGDPGSFLFKAFTLELTPEGNSGRTEVFWRSEEQASDSSKGTWVEIYQDSSGGENWQSRNHINREGQVPCRFRGYQVRSSAGDSAGLRASPTAALAGEFGTLSVAVPEFWQQFPKSLESTSDAVRVGLFPEQWNDLFELQGGERKTHDVWLELGTRDKAGRQRISNLDWVHSPVRSIVPPEWYALCDVFPYFVPAGEDVDHRLSAILGPAIRGEHDLFARREVTDEYGWRNFGDLWADHEQAYYDGPHPVISHYNNQFDVVYGALLQYARTGDPRWLELADPLARHVIDIDIYHTQDDRSAYNNGLFWHTDHYSDVGTCTHRAYSRVNQPPDSPYGGGPGDEHDYATGLLYHYYMTGNPDSRDAVMELAEWVLAMDDGRLTPFFAIDAGATGLATSTAEPNFHGPGRGAGNSINVLLDAWQLTGRDRYLQGAEVFIRRCVHPQDDPGAHDLLNIERRWSYTVFLSALLRYLGIKEAERQIDSMYAYTVRSVERYARWMAEHERPYLDRADELEYPTETWAAQDLRKANVMRLAASYVAEPASRTRVRRRGDELAERAWIDLARFESRRVTRAVALVMTEGSRDAFLTGRTEQTASERIAREIQPAGDFPPRPQFVPQKERVRQALRSPSGNARAAVALLSPWVWPRLIRNLLRVL